jgi:hypothetical protein
VPLTLETLYAARRELLAQSATPPSAMWLLSPELYNRLLTLMPLGSPEGEPPRELFGFRFVVTRHLPAGTDFVLMRDREGRPFECLGFFEEGLADSEPRPLHADPPEPPKVKAASFDEWLKKTAALLEEWDRSRQ